MVVALPKQFGLLRGNVEELDQHTFDSHLSAVILASKDQGSITTRAQLLIHVDLDATQTNDGACDGLHVVGDSHDIRLKTGTITQFLGILDGILHSPWTRVVVTGL
jgi:hypothetical protein